MAMIYEDTAPFKLAGTVQENLQLKKKKKSIFFFFFYKKQISNLVRKIRFFFKLSSGTLKFKTLEGKTLTIFGSKKAKVPKIVL